MIVLDTNILSELMRSQPSMRVASWFKRQARSELAVTVITEMEIFYGLEVLPHGKRRDRLFAAAESVFAEDFARQTLPFDSDAARVYSKIVSARRTMGRPIGQSDAQIAAIVLAHNAVLATRNTMDFDACGISLVNPWED